MAERVEFLGASDGGVDGAPRDWIPWHVPPEATFVHISALGAGSCGQGNPAQNTTSWSLPWGPNAGGCGAGESTVVLPALLLPRVLWLSPGRAQQWSAARATVALDAESSIVALSPSTSTAIVIGPGALSWYAGGAVAADARTGLRALPGTSVAGDNQGATQTWVRAGGGMGGTASGTIVSAGSQTAGGSITGAGNLPTVAGGLGTSLSGTSTSGASAMPLEQSGAFVAQRRGGTGGGAHYLLQGYFGGGMPANDLLRGGDGAPGCGGGGGGVIVLDDSPSRGTSSQGGDGGPGLIQIWWE